MKYLNLFLFEWKHFMRSPFKVIAVLLFMAASVYGLHNGANLYQKHKAEVDKIEKKVEEGRQKIISENYQKGYLVLEDRPWVDFSEPFWAIWEASPYLFKSPSPAMVYSIGQSEQYGFYKETDFLSSPYDADLAEEIANPERLQTGTLDFSFSLLFLMPLLLLVLLYNLKSAETEQGFMPLVEVQISSKNAWLLSRVMFYSLLLILVVVVLMLYGANLTDVLSQSSNGFFQTLSYGFLYLVFWAVLFFFILTKSGSIIGSTLKMTGIYLLFCFIIPASVYQYLSIQQPANLLTEFIDVRDQREEMYNLPNTVFVEQLTSYYPEVKNSIIYADSTRWNEYKGMSGIAMVNELKKVSLEPLKNESKAKNEFIESTFWFNPVTFFLNRFNHISKTHFDDYQAYRNEIQSLIDLQNRKMVIDSWQNVKVDESKYIEYIKIFSK